jgi:hypothetical protein
MGDRINDSPMYDDVNYNPATYTMELDDVWLNSLYALNSECLAKIATILGDQADSQRFTGQLRTNQWFSAPMPLELKGSASAQILKSILDLDQTYGSQERSWYCPSPKLTFTTYIASFVT